MADVELEIRVRYHEVDQMGYVHHPRYLSWFEMARMTLLRALDQPYDRLEAGGLRLPVVRAEVDYLRPLGADTGFLLEADLLELGPASMTLEYRILVDGELATRGRTRHAVLPGPGDRPGPLPADLRAALETLPSRGGDRRPIRDRDPLRAELVE